MTTTAPSSVDETTWAAFVDALAADTEAVPATLKQMRKLSSYRKIPRRALEPTVRLDFEVGWRGLQERRLPASDEHIRAYDRTGEERARQGVTIDDLLEGWQIGLEEAREAIYRHAPDGPLRDPLLLEATKIVTAWSMRGMRLAVAAHRQLELELAREKGLSRGRTVRRILLGDEADGSPRAGELESYGIDPTKDFYAVRVRREESIDLAEVDRWLGTAESGGRQRGLAALIHGDTAGFVASLPTDCPIPVTAGVAGPVPVSQLGDAFRLASRALETAHALGLRGCHGLRDLGLAPAILADDDVGGSLIERYIQPVEQDDRSGAVVLKTVASYIENDSQVDAAAAELEIHPNTVRYRVARFEELTGCSLRHNDDLFEAWWALRRRGLSGSRR